MAVKKWRKFSGSIIYSYLRNSTDYTFTAV